MYSSGRVWNCLACTYQNYEASLKCSLCQAKKPVSSSIDIYNLASKPHEGQQRRQALERSQDSKATKEDIVSTSSTNVDEWQCMKCATSNAAGVERCSICNESRGQVASGISNGLVSSARQFAPTQVSKVRVGSTVVASGITPPRLSSLMPKWRCSHCTFDNYPKAVKCVMCMTPKSAGKSSDCATPAVDHESLLAASRGNSDENILIENTPDASPRPTSPNSARESPHGSTVCLNQACSGAHPSRKCQTGSGSCENLWSRPTPFVEACEAIRDGISDKPVNVFLLSGGDPRQQLTQNDVRALCLTDTSSRDAQSTTAISAGQTLLDLALLFKREATIHLLLNAMETVQQQSKRQKEIAADDMSRRRSSLPCQMCPDQATDVRVVFASNLRQAKDTPFPCYYVRNECPTFSLPREVSALPLSVLKQMLDNIVDTAVQKELEEDGVINWCNEIVLMGSKLYPLRNRAAGDCLLDSVMQATLGIMDRANVLRRALSQSLYDAEPVFFQRWRDYENQLNERFGCVLDESQWDSLWRKLQDLASVQGQPLEELHIFVLAHILRRPIIVYSASFVRSRVSGDKIGESLFQGVYLPILWPHADRRLISRNPIALAYTPGHFSALVALQADDTPFDPRSPETGNRVSYLPLQDNEGKLFPVRFSLSSTNHKRLLTDWLDCWRTSSSGTLVAQQRLDGYPLVVRQLVSDWLNRYLASIGSTETSIYNPIVSPTVTTTSQQFSNLAISSSLSSPLRRPFYQSSSSNSTSTSVLSSLPVTLTTPTTTNYNQTLLLGGSTTTDEKYHPAASITATAPQGLQRLDSDSEDPKKTTLS